MTHTTKRLETSDVEDFKKLLVLFARVFAGGAPTAIAPTASLASLLAKPDFYAIAAYGGGDVIGGLTAYELALPTQKKELYIYDLAVEEAYRGRGVATAVIQTLKTHAKKNGISVLFVEAESKDAGAVAFYASLGAEQLDVKHFNITI